jgi:hypothetical protein
MEHKTAVKMNIAARYVLGDLTEAERNDYEEHMFDCVACAEELKYAERFKVAARVAFAEDPGLGAHYSEHSRFWERMFQAPYVASLVMAAMLVSVGLGGYRVGMVHNGQPGSLQTTANVVTSRAILVDSSRADEKTVLLVKDQPLRFGHFIAGKKLPAYKIEVGTVDGEMKLSREISTAQIQDYFEVDFPAGSLQPGHYFVQFSAIGGNAGEGEVARLPFKLEWKDPLPGLPLQ